MVIRQILLVNQFDHYQDFCMQKREIQIMIKSSNKNQRKISLMDNNRQSLVGLTDENFITDEDWL